MALHWTVNAVEGHDALCYYKATEDRWPDVTKGDSVLHPVTHALIMISMSVGLGGITRKNWHEWWARASLTQDVNGAPMHDGKGAPWFLTPEDVQAHIGLTVNVSRETRAQWLQRWDDDLDQRAYVAECWEEKRSEGAA